MNFKRFLNIVVFVALVLFLFFLHKRYEYKPAKQDSIEKYSGASLEEACLNLEGKKSVNYVNNYFHLLSNTKIAIDKKGSKIIKYWIASNAKEKMYPTGVICSAYFDESGYLTKTILDFK